MCVCVCFGEGLRGRVERRRERERGREGGESKLYDKLSPTNAAGPFCPAELTLLFIYAILIELPHSNRVTLVSTCVR